MSFFNKKKILVTHNGTFHADDLFATATLSILYKDDIRIVRTRDQSQIDFGDVVYDVGGVYDPINNRFDHHQKGGAGSRPNGVPYSSFGLVWKKYGEQICGNSEIAEAMDKKIVQYVDANDNGVNLIELKGEVAPYTFTDIVFAFRPTWKEKQDYDKNFIELVPFAKKIILREIIKIKDEFEAIAFIKKAYEDAIDKRVIILEGNYPWRETIREYNEPLYVVTYKDNMWRAEGVNKTKYSFELRKPFPENWAGKSDKEMVMASGVQEAIFCHNGRFLIIAKTKEAIMELVKKALLA